MEEKKCSKCDKFKYINEFHKNKTVKSGLCACCKQCTSEYQRKRKARNVELRNSHEFIPLSEKKCSKCGVVKDVIEFNSDTGNKDGLHSLCKLCVENYYNKNKEIISLKNKLYYSLNKETISKRIAKHHVKNKNRINMRRRKHYRDNKEKYTEYGKKYYQSNKERISKHTKIHREKNRCMVLEREKKCREKNKDRIKEQRSRIYENNKEAIDILRKEYRISNAKYKLFFNKLTVDESPRLNDDGTSLEILCRYCGKYFIPTQSDAQKRVRVLNGELLGDQYLYCSENCKHSCPVYSQKKYPKGFKKASSREVNSLIRQMCFKRDNWECQICGKSIDEVQLHCHHIEGYTQNPLLGNDIDNVVTLCKECHKEVHKLPGCGYFDLRCKAKGEE